jgi:hypothetical protein
MNDEARQVAVVENEGSQIDRMIEVALRKGGDLDRVEKFYELKLRYEADEARKAFIAAKAAFKAEPIMLTKDKENKQYKSMYTTLGNLVNTVTPFLSKHGLSINWTQTQSDGFVTVTCILEHALGHKETNSFTAPIDTSGQKNAIQQLKSTITYARGITFEGICGLASSDSNLDDDGGGASELTPEQIAENERIETLYDKIKLSETIDELRKLKSEIELIKDAAHRRNLTGAWNARAKELNGASP